MQATYGVDLREACYGPRRIGLRRLRSLIDGLPPQGALHRAADPEGWDWRNDEELLATLIEMVDYGNRLSWAAITRSSRIPDPMIQIRRPNMPVQVVKPKRKATYEETIAFFTGRR